MVERGLRCRVPPLGFSGSLFELHEGFGSGFVRITPKP